MVAILADSHPFMMSRCMWMTRCNHVVSSNCFNPLGPLCSLCYITSFVWPILIWWCCCWCCCWWCCCCCFWLLALWISLSIWFHPHVSSPIFQASKWVSFFINKKKGNSKNGGSNKREDKPIFLSLVRILFYFILSWFH